MKVTARFRRAVLVPTLFATVRLCLFSKPYYEATNDRMIFEECEEPITFLRLSHIALDPRLRSSVNACINNLRQLDAAKQQWALENNKSITDIPSWTGVKLYMGRDRNGTRLSTLVSTRWCLPARAFG